MEKIDNSHKIKRTQTTMKKLITRLESSNSWYNLSIYLDKKYIVDDFIPWLRIIEKDPKMHRGKLKNPKAIISNAIRQLISAYKKSEQRNILTTQNLNTADNTLPNETDID